MTQYLAFKSLLTPIISRLLRLIFRFAGEVETHGFDFIVALFKVGAKLSIAFVVFGYAELRVPVVLTLFIAT